MREWGREKRVEALQCRHTAACPKYRDVHTCMCGRFPCIFGICTVSAWRSRNCRSLYQLSHKVGTRAPVPTLSSLIHPWYAKSEESLGQLYAKSEESLGQPYVKSEESLGQLYAKSEESLGQPYVKSEESLGQLYAKSVESLGQLRYGLHFH